MKVAVTITGVALSALLGLILLIASVIPGSNEDQADFGGKGGLKAVPAAFREPILDAARACKHPELTPALLAAQLYQESGFNTSRSLRSPAGALGPAQFIPTTWATWGRDVDGKNGADPFDVEDAVSAQGRLMCSLIGQAKKSGIRGDIRTLALAGYNAGWGAVESANNGAGGVPPYRETQNYVKIIMSMMKKFEAAGGGGKGSLNVSGSGSGPDALRKAATRLGTPYAYGGGGPGGPTTGFCDDGNGYKNGRCLASSTTGFDCSSLMQYAYWPKVKLPRTAAAQYHATSDRPVAKGDLKVGDLLFWAGNGGGIYHVAMYAGDGKVLQAPRTGRNVEVRPISQAMPAAHYAGATRP